MNKRTRSHTTLSDSCTSPEIDDDVSTDSKKRKTEIRRTSIDRSFRDLGKLGDEWKVYYNQKGLLVRMAVSTKPNNPSELLEIPTSVKKIKFFSRDTPEAEIKCEECVVLGEGALSENLLKSEVSVGWPGMQFGDTGVTKSPLFEELRKCVDSCGLTYGPDVPGWHNHPKDDLETVYENMRTPGSQMLLCSLREAFSVDMRNGEGKEFLRDLSRGILEFFGMEHTIRVTTPSTHYGANTKVEIVALEDEANYRRPYTLEAPSYIVMGDDPPFLPSGHYPFTKACAQVPDLVWNTGNYSGQDSRFLLVVEAKPDCLANDGLFQCLKQMFSKLFFQSAIFGLLFTPARYQLLFASKRKGVVRFRALGQSLLKDSTNSQLVFDIDAFYHMVEWLGKIIAAYVKEKQDT